MEKLMRELRETYERIKKLHPICTKPKGDCDLKKLVEQRFCASFYYFGLDGFDWTDIDGILDYLYGRRAFFGENGATEIIEFIESNCEETT